MFHEIGLVQKPKCYGSHLHEKLKQCNLQKQNEMKTKDLGAKNGNMKLKGQDLRQKE